MNYSRFINEMSSARKPSLIRELTKIYASASPNVVFLAGGFPNVETFPFESAKVTLKDGSSFTIGDKLMSSALQYQQSQGYPPLLNWLRDFQMKLHKPPLWNERDLIITNGSQDGLAKIIDATMNRGDSIIVPDTIYTGFLAIVAPYKPRYIQIEQDKDGLIPSKLRKAIQSKWKIEDFKNDTTAPKLLYLNPTGANPTGTNLTSERKQEIYNIACEYDLLILEDDPYYFLHFEKDNPTSFLSIDREGRVVRFDSFSKVISSGLRLGFTTGPKPLIRQLELHMQSSVLHASSMSQVLASQLLEKWGWDGFMQHIQNVQEFYRRKRDIMVEAAEKHLKGLVEYHVPMGGMFLWIRVLAVKDVYDMVMKRGIGKDIMLVPGHAFAADPSLPCSYVRASFSSASAEQVDRGFACLADLIKEEQSVL